MEEIHPLPLKQYSSHDASDFTRTAMNSLVSPRSSERINVPELAAFGCNGAISEMITLWAFTTILQHFFCFCFFFVGIQQADEAEMKLMASTPYRTHIYNVATFDAIKNVQKEFIAQVCAGVDDQLNSLISGEEGEMWQQIIDSLKHGHLWHHLQVSKGPL